MKNKIKLFLFLLILFPFFASCGGNDNGVIYKESNENAALSVLHYVKNTTCLENMSQMEDKDMLSFKMVSGNSTVAENNGNGKVYMSYSYTIRGSKVEKSKSFDVKNYGVVSIRGTEATVVSNPTDVDKCPNFKPSESRYVDVKLVNQMFKMYNETGKENILDGAKPEPVPNIPVTDSKEFEYSLEENGIKITKYKGKKSEVSIPKTIKYNDGETYDVTSIDYYAFSRCSSLTTIVIPNSVISIKSWAFYLCNELRTITFEDGGKLTIEYAAFAGCHSLTSIELPNSLTSIEYPAIDCNSLQYNEYDNCLYLGSKKNRYLVLVGAKDRNITEATINNNTRFILTAFRYCGLLSSIVIPNSVTSIGESAFEECSSLKSIVIPNSVTSIGDNAFSRCRSLTSIVIPSSVTISIGDEAFYDCSSLTSIVIPNNVTSIGDKAFYNCSSLTSIVIPNSVTSIGDGAFYNCSSLIIYCEASGKPSEWNNYWNSSNRPVYWGINENNYLVKNGLIYVIQNGEAVVTGHEGNITKAIIPETIKVNGTTYSVTSIGNEAFYNCSSLTSIVIPNSVTSIGDGAFYNCSSLIIYCEASGKPSEWNNYWTSSNRPVYWGINENNYLVKDGIIYVIQDGEAIVTGHEENITNVIIPETIEVNGETYSVTMIGYYAFYNCSSLTSIVIPDSVTTIRSYVFYNCYSLTIYCEASSKPWGWYYYDWNPSNSPVYWGGQWSYVNGVPTPNINNL